MLANAISFLTHDKVRGSPEAHKRAFLLQKGLTDAEVDEAFRRVPQAKAVVPAAAPAVPAPAPAATSGGGQMVAAAPPRQPMTWGKMAIYAGSLAAAAYGAAELWKTYLLPRLAEACGSDEAKGARAAAEEAAKAAKEAVAAVERATADRSAQMDATAAALESQAAELREALDAVGALGAMASGESGSVTVEEMRAEMSTLVTSIASLQATVQQGNAAKENRLRSLETELADVKAALEDKSLGVSDRVALLGRVAAAERNSKGKGKEKVGEAADSHAALEAAAAAAIYAQKTAMARSPSNSVDGAAAKSVSGAATPTPAPPASYAEVMEMIQRGETPPGIEKVNDTPPNPNAAVSEAKMAPPRKPWEDGGSEDGAENAEGSVDASGSGSGGAGGSNWWQQPGALGQPPIPEGVRLEEIVEHEATGSGSGASGSGSGAAGLKGWTPPAAPSLSEGVSLQM